MLSCKNFAEIGVNSSFLSSIPLRFIVKLRYLDCEAFSRVTPNFIEWDLNELWLMPMRHVPLFFTIKTNRELPDFHTAGL